MTQKEAQKEEAPKKEPAKLVPVKVETGNSFLSHLQFELTHLDYTAAGSVSRAEISMKYQPLEIGVSVGALDLDYNSQALFFITPRASLDYPGEHVELYLDASSAIVFGGGKTRTIAFPYISAGAVVEPIKPGEHKGFGLQLGLEAQLTTEGREIDKMEQTLVTAETGAAFTFRPITLYATEEVFFETETPYQASDERVLKPKHGKAGGGVSLRLKGASFGTEFSWGPVEKEAKFNFSVDARYVQPTISVYAKKRNYGLGDEFGITLSLDFGEKRKVGTARVEQAFGNRGEGWDEATWTDTQSLANAASIPSQGKESFDFFLDALKSSKNLDEFVGKYKSASFSEKIYAAWALMYGGGINFKVLSDDKIEALAVEGTYEKIREYALTGEKTEAGDCVNLGSLAGEFLRRSGVDAYGIGIFDTRDGHMLTIARSPDGKESYLMDMYGITKFEGGNTWTALQAYAARRGLLLHQVRIYGDENKIVGIYKGPEGNMIEEAAAQRERKGLGRKFVKRIENE